MPLYLRCWVSPYLIPTDTSRRDIPERISQPGFLRHSRVISKISLSYLTGVSACFEFGEKTFAKLFLSPATKLRTPAVLVGFPKSYNSACYSTHSGKSERHPNCLSLPSRQLWELCCCLYPGHRHHKTSGRLASSAAHSCTKCYCITESYVTAGDFSRMSYKRTNCSSSGLKSPKKGSRPWRTYLGRKNQQCSEHGSPPPLVVAVPKWSVMS